MTIDKTTKILLFLIATALWALVLEPTAIPTRVKAQQTRDQRMVVTLDGPVELKAPVELDLQSMGGYLIDSANPFPVQMVGQNTRRPSRSNRTRSSNAVKHKRAIRR
jgi:hypothetical protein